MKFRRNDNIEIILKFKRNDNIDNNKDFNFNKLYYL